MDRKSNPVTRYAALGAIVLGLGAGSYGLASAASGSGSSTGSIAATTTTTASTPAAARRAGARSAPTKRRSPVTLAKVTAVAKDALPGATIVRVETDADGNARSTRHVVKSDGTLATVYVDDSFKLVSVEPAARRARRPPPPRAARRMRRVASRSTLAATPAAGPGAVRSAGWMEDRACSSGSPGPPVRSTASACSSASGSSTSRRT